MSTEKRVQVLLIEGDEICRRILLNRLMREFSHIKVHATTTPSEALELLQAKEHEIVVCDALLAKDERIRFTWQMYTEADPLVIVITADTDLRKDSFPPDIKDVCVQHVTYKPLDMSDLILKVEDAIESIEKRREYGK